MPDHNASDKHAAVSWQFLVNNVLGGPLDEDNLVQYDQLIQACLKTGAYCMIDVHNFARWNGDVIGQSGPAGVTDEQFVSLWQQLAVRYANEPNLMFSIMNEPHDLNVTQWAMTCQKVVTAIRNADATQLILLPGTNFDSAATLVSSGSADALLAITNPDGSTTGLLLDIHKYLDINNSGTHSECVMDNIANFTIVAEYLRQAGRQGMISETGAGTEQSVSDGHRTQAGRAQLLTWPSRAASNTFAPRTTLSPRTLTCLSASSRGVPATSRRSTC